MTTNGRSGVRWSAGDAERRAPRVGWGVVFVLVLWQGAASASAQAEGSFFVVGARHAGTSDAALPVEAVEAALRPEGTTPLTPDTARARFVAAHSGEPAVITPSDVAALERCYHEAGLSLARGRLAAAGEQVQRCIDRANEVRETLVRDAAGAESFLRACAVQVQFFLSSGRGDDALRQATECRLVASDLPLSARAAPPEVRAIFDAADHALAALEPATIEVRSQPQSGCAVWLRGQNVGITPAVVPGLLPGRADLQVECAAGQAGRVHRVNFRAGRNLVTIDTRFEQAVQTSGRLRLAYASPRELAAHRAEDALTIGRAVGVAELLLVSLDDERAAALIERIDVARGVVRGRASIGLRGGALEPQGLAAARAALAGDVRVEALPIAPSDDEARALRVAEADTAPRSGEGGARGGLAATATTSEQGPGDDDGAPRGARLVAGVVLGVLGAGGLAGGWAFHAVSRAELARLRAAFVGDPDFDARAAAFDDATTLSYALGVPGGALLTASVPLLLPEAEGVPWWSWALGGVGVAGIAVGGWALAQEGTADGMNADGSIRLRRTASLGVMLGMSALPLLAVPLTHGIRALGAGDSAQAEVSVAAGGAVLRVGGTW
jgi:hypothetical protein